MVVIAPRTAVCQADYVHIYDPPEVLLQNVVLSADYLVSAGFVFVYHHISTLLWTHLGVAY